MQRLAPQSAVLKAALIQVVAASLAWMWPWLLKQGSPLAQWFSSTVGLVLFQASMAVLLARLSGAPNWWLWIHAAFGPLLVLALLLQWPSWVWGLGFAVLLLVFWRTDQSQVPLYLSNSTTVGQLVQVLPDKPCYVADLGCGDGRVLHQLARARPDCQFVGFEHAPLPCLWAKVANFRLANVQIHWGSFWDQSLEPYSLVYAFLSPVPMRALWLKACEEMSPDSRLVSNSFEVPDVQPLARIEVDDTRQTQLWIYQPDNLYLEHADDLAQPRME